MYRLLFLLFLPTTFLAAQQPDYLKNPDIVWAADIEQDWIVDNPSLENEWEDGITTLKLLRLEKYRWDWDSPYLADLVCDAAEAGYLPIFEDPQCTVPATFNRKPQILYDVTKDGDIIPKGRVKSVPYATDTIITYDPETSDRQVVAVHTEYPPLSQVKAWRIRGTMNYNAKKASWSLNIQAVAPLVKQKIENADSVAYKPLFWFRTGDKQPRFDSKHTIWAKRIVSKRPDAYLPVIQPHMLKVIDGFQNPIEHQFRVLATDMKTPFYGPGNEMPLTKEERLSMLSKTDTIVTFDPETYEEKVMLARTDLNPEIIQQLRLMQTWYWDEKKHRLFIRLDAVAPMIDVTDSYGNFRYQRPLYYRRQ